MYRYNESAPFEQQESSKLEQDPTGKIHRRTHVTEKGQCIRDLKCTCAGQALASAWTDESVLFSKETQLGMTNEQWPQARGGYKPLAKYGHLRL